MLDETLLMHLVHQVRAEEPGTLAIVLHGSYARGASGPHSDVDLEVMLSGTPRAHYQTLLVEQMVDSCTSR
jgi:predicted nucleotidyltransferase